MKKYIGFSLSFCFIHYLLGVVTKDQISAIVSSTKFDDWQHAFDYYFINYWSKYADADTCKEKLQEIWSLVFQPRLNNPDHKGHYIGHVLWLNTETGISFKHFPEPTE